MAMVSIDLDMNRVTNERFLEKANSCAPKLKESIVHPVSVVDIRKNGRDYPDVSVLDVPENIPNYHMIGNC